MRCPSRRSPHRRSTHRVGLPLLATDLTRLAQPSHATRPLVIGASRSFRIAAAARRRVPIAAHPDRPDAKCIAASSRARQTGAGSRPDRPRRRAAWTRTQTRIRSIPGGVRTRGPRARPDRWTGPRRVWQRRYRRCRNALRAPASIPARRGMSASHDAGRLGIGLSGRPRDDGAAVRAACVPDVHRTTARRTTAAASARFRARSSVRRSS